MSLGGAEPFAPVGVGGELRMARDRHGWSLADVAATLRIRLPYLEAIEAGRLSELPGNAYAVGFVRTYATALGLDPAEICRRFKAEEQNVTRKTELAFPAPVPERGVPVGAVLLLGVLLTAGSYAVWYRYSGDTAAPVEMVPNVPERLALLAEPARPPSNPSPQVASILPPGGTAAIPGPIAASPAMPVPVPAAGAATSAAALAAITPSPAAVDASRVVLRFKADSYVQVKEKQGGVLLNRVMRAGETWPMPRGQTLLLTTGNAGGTELVVDGVASPSLGAAGLVRRDVVIDVDTLKPGVALLLPKPAPSPAPVPAASDAIR